MQIFPGLPVVLRGRSQGAVVASSVILIACTSCMPQAEQYDADQTIIAAPTLTIDSVEHVAFDQAFTITHRFTLEETDDVINVSIFAAHDPEGILITDRVERQVRLYDHGGRLKWHFGRGGDGPGEFSTPRPAARVGRRVATVDSRRRLTTWVPGRGPESVKVANLPNHDVEDVDAIDDERILLSTRGLRPGLIVWNMTTEQEELSFFHPWIPDDVRYASYTWSRSDVRGSRILTSISTSDTLYVHDAGGRLLSRVLMGIPHLLAPEPPEGLGRSVRLTDWASSGSMVLSPYWESDSVVVAWVRTADSTPMRLRYGIMVADMAGRRIWVHDTPRLLLINDGEYLLQDPAVAEGNVLMMARRRGSP